MKNEYDRLPMSNFTVAANIAYGEEPPLVPREDQPVVTEDRGGKKNGTSDEMMTGILDRFLAQLTTKLVSAIESVVANALGNGSNGKESNEKSRIPTNEEGNVRSNNGKTHTSKTVTDFEMNRKTNSVSGNKVKDVEYSCSSKDSSVLVVGNCRTRSKTSVVTPMDKRLMTFVCGWKELRDNTLARVGDHYVWMSAKLYTKSLARKEFLGRSKSILMDPSYELMLNLGKKNHEHLAHEIRIIDSLYENPFEEHAAIVQSCNSCGVFMLACIKVCAHRFYRAYDPDKVNTIRQQLFLHDANNEFNEVRDKWYEILPADRRGCRRLNSEITA
uniref:Uncharacterized protein n=1 Tax=Chenopodium quinoa TaxID=63459 RepID=A0A803NAG4_CHEQI